MTPNTEHDSNAASIKAILKACDVNELQRLGTYTAVKTTIEKEIGLKLATRSWLSLHQKIRSLKQLVPENEQLLLSALEDQSILTAKARILNAINVEITSNSRKELKETIEKLVKIFTKPSFDPYRRFEETKLKNFKSSSKLEGIEIETPDESVSLESILDEYRKQG